MPRKPKVEYVAKEVHNKNELVVQREIIKKVQHAQARIEREREAIRTKGEAMKQKLERLILGDAGGLA